MSEENEKQRISNKDIAEQIVSIVELTNSLKQVVDGMPKCAARDAYEHSVTNLEKKNNRFSKTRAKLTDEEKQVMRDALKKFREQNSETEVSEVPADDEPVSSEEGVSKKRKGKHA